jgi:PmbA protein
MLDYIIKKAQKLGAEDIIVTSLNQLARQTKFANNEIVVNQTWDESDIDIFLAFKKKTISTSVKSDAKKSEVDKTLNKMMKIAKLLKPSEDYFGIAEGKFDYKNVEDGYDKQIDNLQDKEVDFVNAAINKALENGVKKSSGVLYSNCWQVEKLTSNGIDVSEKGTGINFSIRSFADKDASAHSVSVSRILKGFDPVAAADEASLLALQSLNPSLGEEGKYDVIFHPMVFANILFYMSYAFSAFQVDSGLSFFIDKIGKKVANEIVTIEDDGLLKNGFGSRSFDDEGMSIQKTALVENGILKNYLHNTSTAKKFKTESTGNAGLIDPVPWNIVLSKGDSKLEEMISEVDRGLYITNAWYTRFANYRTGDFSTIPRDAMFEIVDGRIVRAVKDLRISDNMQRILENVKMISKDRKIIQWWEVQIPVVTGFVLCKDVGITRSKK